MKNPELLHDVHTSTTKELGLNERGQASDG